MRDLIVTALELLALLLFGAAVAWALWPVYPPAGIAAAAVVVGVGAWWAGRPVPKDTDQ